MSNGSFFEPEKITYKEEGFDDFLIRQFDFARDTSSKTVLQSEPTKITVPGGDIEWPKFDIPPNSPYVDGSVKGVGIMSIGGSISSGTDVALPNLYVTKTCKAFELIASAKTVSSTITFNVKVNNVSIGTILVDTADTLFGSSIDYTLSPDDSITVDVTGGSGQDGTVGIRVRQDVDIL